MAAPADGLTVRRARIVVNPRKTSSFTIAATFPPLTADQVAHVQTIGLRLDTFSMIALQSELTPKKVGRKGTVYVYKNKNGSTPGIHRLRIDFEKGRLAAAGRRLALAGIASPMQVQFATDVSNECTTLRFVQYQGRDALSPLRLTLPRGGNAGPCDVERPVFIPENVFENEPAAVRAEVVVSGAPADRVELRRLSNRGQSSKDTLCTMAVTPTAGTYSCTMVMDESAGTIAVAAFVERSGEKLISPEATLTATKRVSDEEAAKEADTVQRAAADSWKKAYEQYGDTERARVEALAAIAKNPGVSSVARTPDGSLQFTNRKSGIIGLILLSSRQEFAAAMSVDGRRVAEPNVLAPHQPRALRESAEARVITNNQVFIYDPGQRFFREEYNEAPVIDEMMAQSVCPQFQTTFLRGTDATLAAFAQASRNGTVAISSHGFQTRRGDIGIVTGNAINYSNIQDSDTTGLLPLLQQKDLVLINVPPEYQNPGADPYDTIVGIRPVWVQQYMGGFSDPSFVYASTCHGTRNRTLANAFFGKGVTAWLGYSRAVDTRFASVVGVQLFQGLLAEQTTLDDAYASVPKVDSYGGADPARLLALGDTNLTYLGEVTLKPASSTIRPGDSVTLTAELEGSESCDLLYEWSNTGSVGHLSGGDNVENESPTATYTANSAPETEGTDTVEVVISARGGSSNEMLGRASATISVEPMTTTTSTTTSTTSTTSSTLACPGCDWEPYQSGCGSISVSPSVVRPGDRVTVTVSFGCGNAGVMLSSSLPTIVVDGVPTTGIAGVPPMYGYAGWCCCGWRPSPDSGYYVWLTQGSHTLEFTIDPQAAPDCVRMTGNTSYGPFAVLTGGNWTSPRPFTIIAP